MKKMIFGASIFLMMFGLTVFAENTQRSGDILTITPNINEENINDINNIGLVFCNDGLENNKLTKELKIETRPGERQEICAVFYNRFLDRGMKVNVGFNQGVKRSDGIISCDENTSNNILANMIQNNTKDYTFILSGNEKLLKKFRLAIPNTATGNIYGCVSYNLPDNYSKSTGDVFGIMVRKVAPIEITITGDIYNLGRRDDIRDGVVTNKNSILKVIIAILGLWIIVSIIQTARKKEKHHHKKK